MITVDEAIRALSPIGGDTLADLKKAYHAAALKYHPDVNPHGSEIMKIINNAYELLRNRIGHWSVKTANQAAADIIGDLENIWNKIKTLPGLEFEICGNWLWVTGDTYNSRKALHSAGLHYSKNKQAWYWHPEGYQKHTRRQFNLDEIRAMHGSKNLYGEEAEPLAY